MNPQVSALADMLRQSPAAAVLTGAGISTRSGIPDYRDENGNWKHSQPVQFAEFRDSQTVRQRYWARSFAGWRTIRDASPNAAHAALASLQASNFVGTIVTQNVDRLHSRAGSETVIDLHGRLDRVVCMRCQRQQHRNDWQQRLAEWNSAAVVTADDVLPDGDAAVSERAASQFNVPPCEHCDGIVKPDVVFFGENVPKLRVERAREAVLAAATLVVIGSSLMVYSGLRFVKLALDSGMKVAIVNRGVTRADELAHLKIEDDCADVLKALKNLLPERQRG